MGLCVTLQHGLVCAYIYIISVWCGAIYITLSMAYVFWFAAVLFVTIRPAARYIR